MKELLDKLAVLDEELSALLNCSDKEFEVQLHELMNARPDAKSRTSSEFRTYRKLGEFMLERCLDAAIGKEGYKVKIDMLDAALLHFDKVTPGLDVRSTVTAGVADRRFPRPEKQEDPKLIVQEE